MKKKSHVGKRQTLPKISPLLLVSLMGMAAGALTACGAEPQASHTNLLLPAVGTVASFGLDSDMPADDMSGLILERLQGPPLRDSLSCNPSSDRNPDFSCSRRHGDDVISARFDRETRTLVLLLTPLSIEPGYEPDFEYFHTLEQMVGEALIAAFGADAVTINPS